MGRPYKLEPWKDKQKGKWCLGIPPELSISGKRERKFYDSEEKAKEAARKIKIRKEMFGTSLRILSPENMAEASQCWRALGEHQEKTGDQTTLREITLAYIRRYNEAHKSVTLNALFAEYLQVKTKRKGKYLQQVEYCREKMSTIGRLLVCDIKPTQIKNCLANVPSGNRNAYMRYLRAIFNLGIKRGYLSANPISALDSFALTLANQIL